MCASPVVPNSGRPNIILPGSGEVWPRTVPEVQRILIQEHAPVDGGRAGSKPVPFR